MDGSLPLCLQVVGVEPSHCVHISALDLCDIKDYCCVTEKMHTMPLPKA